MRRGCVVLCVCVCVCVCVCEGRERERERESIVQWLGRSTPRWTRTVSNSGAEITEFFDGFHWSCPVRGWLVRTERGTGSASSSQFHYERIAPVLDWRHAVWLSCGFTQRPGMSGVLLKNAKSIPKVHGRMLFVCVSLLCCIVFLLINQNTGRYKQNTKWDEWVYLYLGLYIYFLLLLFSFLSGNRLYYLFSFYFDKTIHSGCIWFASSFVKTATLILNLQF